MVLCGSRLAVVLLLALALGALPSPTLSEYYDDDGEDYSEDDYYSDAGEGTGTAASYAGASVRQSAMIQHDEAMKIAMDGKVDEAIAGFVKATEIDDTCAACWHDLGVAHMNVKSARGSSERHPAALKAAKKCFEKSMELEPDDKTTEANYAQAVRLLQDADPLADIIPDSFKARKHTPFVKLLADVKFAAAAQLVRDGKVTAADIKRVRMPFMDAMVDDLLEWLMAEDFLHKAERYHVWDLIIEVLPLVSKDQLNMDMGGQRAKLNEEWMVGRANMPDALPITPLVLATRAQHIPAMEYLIAHGGCDGLEELAMVKRVLAISDKDGSFLDSLSMVRDLIFRGEEFRENCLSRGICEHLDFKMLADFEASPSVKAAVARSKENWGDDGTYTLYSENLRDAANSWALKMAKTLGKCPDTKALLRHHERKTGSTPMHEAAIWGNTEAVKWLIAEGADVNAQDKTGWTALHVASTQAAIKTISALQEAGADESIADEVGRTAADLASSWEPKPTNRMRDEPEFRARVAKYYQKHGQDLEALGGWSNYTVDGVSIDYCDFDEISADQVEGKAGREWFFKQYVLSGRPVIIRGGTAKWKTRKGWTRKGLLRNAGGARMPDVGEIPYKSLYSTEDGTYDKNTYSMNQFVEKFMDAAPDATLKDMAPQYVFHPPTQQSMSITDGISPRMPDFIKDLDLDNSQEETGQFYLGNPLTGAPLHYHNAAWNGMSYGSKRWFIFPPQHGAFSTRPALDFYRKDYPRLIKEKGFFRPLQCMQHDADLMIMPEWWGHCTVNSRASIGIAKEFGGWSVHRFALRSELGLDKRTKLVDGRLVKV